MQWIDVNGDVSEHACILKDFITDQGSSGDKKHGELVIGVAVALEPFNLLWKTLSCQQVMMAGSLG